MEIPHRLIPARIALFACALCLGATSLPGHSQAAPASGDSKPGDKSAPEKPALPPLPAPAHTQQQITFDGKPLKYTVTIGSIPVRDKDGKEAGEVVTTAYTMEAKTGP